MQTLNKEFPRSRTEARVSNVGGGATITSGSIVDLGGLGWGAVIADIPVGAEGAAHLAGRLTLPKATGFAASVGQAVGWHTTNLNAIAATGGKPLGCCTKAAASGDTTIEVELNVPGELYDAAVVGDASGGLEVDLGFGAVPAGAVIVQSTTAAGVLRTVSSVVKETGGDAGKITITTSAGAADDIHHIYARR